MGASRGLQDNIPGIVKGSSTTVTLAATHNGQSTRITVGGQQYRVSSALSLSTATTGQGGLDTGAIAANTLYYVYAAVSSSSVIGLVASLTGPATGPSGFAGRYKLLGRFRTDSGGTSINTVAPDASIAPQGATTEWQSYTTTVTGFGSKSIDINNCRWRRVGNSMEVRAFISTNTTAAGAGGTDVTFSIPPGYTVDNSNFSGVIGPAVGSSSVYGILGVTQFDRAYDVYYRTTTAVTLLKPGSNSTLTQGDLNTTNENEFSLEFCVPIAEWSGLFT